MSEPVAPTAGMRPDFAAILAGDAVAVPTEQWEAAQEAMVLVQVLRIQRRLSERDDAEAARIIALFSSKIGDAANV